MLKNLAELVGIEKHCTVHLFRKTLASLLYRRGMDPKKIAHILGHSDSRTSEAYYITISTEDIKHDYIKYR